jgi:tellurite resistance protein TehA-like permease
MLPPQEASEMPVTITMPLVVTVYGAAAIVSSALALALAGAKRRDAQSWAFWSFLFPPAILALLLTRRRTPEEAQVRKLTRALRPRDDD